MFSPRCVGDELFAPIPCRRGLGSRPVMTGRFALTFDVSPQCSVTLYFARCFREPHALVQFILCKGKSLRPKPEATTNRDGQLYARTFCKSLLVRQSENQRSRQFRSISIRIGEFRKQVRDRFLLFRRPLLTISEKLGARFILRRQVLGRDPRVVREIAIGSHIFDGETDTPGSCRRPPICRGSACYISPKPCDTPGLFQVSLSRSYIAYTAKFLPVASMSRIPQP